MSEGPQGDEEGLPTFPGSKTRHGTHSGWVKHQTLGEKPCDPCSEARRVYEHQRNQDPSRKDEVRSRNKARRRALNTLARRHREEFSALYQDELIRIYRDEDF